MQCKSICIQLNLFIKNKCFNASFPCFFAQIIMNLLLLRLLQMATPSCLIQNPQAGSFQTRCFMMPPGPDSYLPYEIENPPRHKKKFKTNIPHFYDRAKK